MPVPQAVESGAKVIRGVGQIGAGGAEEAGAVGEAWLDAFRDKRPQKSPQTELSLVKTAAVGGHDDALDALEALEVAKSGGGRGLT